jgi:hypothetical protein
MDILPLGVNWRFPIILTELLPQPFPPTDPSFAAQIPTNYGDRLHQQEGIKDYTKQELVLQDHYHCVLGFLTLVNTTVDLPRPEEVPKHNARLWSAHPKLGNNTTGEAIMSFLCAQNFSYQDLSNDTTLHQIKLNSTTDSDGNVKKLTISLASAYPNLYPKQPINFITEDGSITESVASFNFSLSIFLNKTFHVTFFNNTGQPADTGTAPRTVFSHFAGKMNLTVYALMNMIQFSNIHRIGTIPSNLECDIPTYIHEAQYKPRQALPYQSNIAEQPIPLHLVAPVTRTTTLNAQKLNYKWLPGQLEL